MTSLFISYSRKDIQSAQRLTESFKGQGLVSSILPSMKACSLNPGSSSPWEIWETCIAFRKNILKQKNIS